MLKSESKEKELHHRIQRDSKNGMWIKSAVLTMWIHATPKQSGVMIIQIFLAFSYISRHIFISGVSKLNISNISKNEWVQAMKIFKNKM